MGSYGANQGTTFSAGRLWAGGLATALVAALVATVGILVSRGLLGIPVLAPDSQGVWGSANTMTYALVSAGVALLATALMQLLQVATPTPGRFFGWIMGLLTVVAVAVPLTLVATLEERIATAIINLMIGLAITFLLLGVSSSARQPVSPPYPYTGPPSPPPPPPGRSGQRPYGSTEPPPAGIG